ncbi:MAG: hypothetical protein P9X24_07250 [Candidatus Hatepunaea meridiana]|nr:hypothetical protein [Candidatus Hatepunaea meridiana]
MIKKILYYISLFFVIAGITSAQTEFEGEISGEWDTEGSPYIQVGNAEVPADESLSILPGVEVILGEDLSITVNGLLTATGNEEDTIRFHGQEGLVSGRIRLQSGDNMARFSYCQFDSLDAAIWGNIDSNFRVRNCFFYDNDFAIECLSRWAEITQSSFICMSERGNIRGNVKLGRNRGFNENPEADITFSDNWLLGRTGVDFECECAVAERNRSERTEIGDRDYTPGLTYWDSRHVFSRDNRIGHINVINEFRGLIEATVSDNVLTRHLAFLGGGNGEVNCDSNVCTSLSFSGTRNAVATGNVTRGIVFYGDTRVTLIRNIGDVGLSGNDNIVTLVNNTIWDTEPHERFPVVPAIINLSGDNPVGNRVILRNNLIFAHRCFPYGIDERIEVEGEGYNCLFNVEQAYAEREDPLPNDLLNEDPLLRSGFPFDYHLRADSPCIDAGNPDSPRDPDSTRADIGCYYFDQAGGEPPALDRQWDYYIGWNETFRYAARAVDEGE